VFEHLSDYLMLMPQGYEDGDALKRCIFQLERTGREQARGRSQRGPEPGPTPRHIHHQVVQAANQDCCRQGRKDREHQVIDHLNRVVGLSPYSHVEQA
jgi:hypothetical protein